MSTAGKRLFQKRKRVYVVVAEKKSGKSTVMDRVLLQRELLRLTPVRVITTRELRPTSERGVDETRWYESVSLQDFNLYRRSGSFVECVNYRDVWYGITWEELGRATENGPAIVALVPEGIPQLVENGFEVSVIRLIPQGHSHSIDPHDGDYRCDLEVVNDFSVGPHVAAQKIIDHIKKAA